ncbi:Phosphosulfolactate synthase [subsurface metagenome]|jgi:phosphosulfolactate synthase
MYNDLFSNIPIKKRREKPREFGLTVIIEQKLGLKLQKDSLNLMADYIDLVKIATGVAALIEDQTLRKKIDLYHENNILAFPGGQFLEYVITKNKVREYFSDVIKAGFKLVEVSDNLIDISPEKKCGLVKMAKQEYGLKVLGETGSKKVFSDIKLLINDIKNCLECGAWKVMFEAAELFESGKFKSNIIKAISQEVDIKNIIFELPGSWIPKIAVSDIYSLQVWLIENLGPDVNIANVDPFEVLDLEVERMNLFNI